MVGWGVTYPSACALEVAQNKATEVSRHLEVLAEDLIIHYQVFSLRAAGDIVEQFLRKKINLKQLLASYVCVSGNVQGWLKI